MKQLLLLMCILSTLNAFGEIEIIGKSSIDFGKYPSREKKVATYKIKNTGKTVIKIIKIRKTCGCASATASKTALKPKEEADIKVTILPNSIFGIYSKNTFVESNDPDNRFLKLTVSGNAVPLVEIKPKGFLYAGRIPLNKEWSQVFDLKMNEPGAILGKPLTKSDHTVESSLKQDGAKYKFSIKLLPVSEAGDLKCLTEIPILTPSNYPPVKISLTGKIGTEVYIVPGTAYIPVSDKPTTRQFTLRILGEQTINLNPQKITLPKHKEISFKTENNTDRHSLIVTATFSPEFTKELFAEEKISLSFKVPNAASGRIICKTAP